MCIRDRVDIDRLVGSTVWLPPDFGEELSSPYDGAGSLREICQQVEFLSRQRQCFLSEFRLPRSKIDPQLANGQDDLFLIASATPKHCSDPRVEMGCRERFDDVVVRSSIEQLDD